MLWSFVEKMVLFLGLEVFVMREIVKLGEKEKEKKLKQSCF